MQGFNEPLKVTKFSDLETYFNLNKDNAVARYVYVWTLVPMLPNAPYWPVFMVASNNKFTSRWVYEWWEYIAQVSVECGIELYGFNHDGDSRCRKGDFQILLHSPCNRMHILKADGEPHEFMYLSIGELDGLQLISGQDFFHVQMRSLGRRMSVTTCCIAFSTCHPAIRDLEPVDQWQGGASMQRIHLSRQRSKNGREPARGVELAAVSAAGWEHAAVSLFEPASHHHLASHLLVWASKSCKNTQVTSDDIRGTHYRYACRHVLCQQGVNTAYFLHRIVELTPATFI